MLKRKNVGVILAGGMGERFNANTPKQFTKIAGKTVIEHTIDAFEKSSVIDEIAVVINDAYMMKIEEMLVNNKWSKVKKILNGGHERYQSSLSAIRAYTDQKNINIIFHDAVRPLLSQRVLYDIDLALNRYDAVDVAISATDTIIKTDTTNSIIDEVPDRSMLYQGQTPQAFKLEVIERAYELALQDPDFKTTDDCGVVVRYLPDVPVYIVEGERQNIKLTHIEDLYQMDKLFQLNTTKLLIDTDFSELAGRVIMIFGGNSGIGKAIYDIAKKNGAKTYSFSRSTTDTDITNLQDIQSAFKKVLEIESKIDYVVNTAAVLKREAFHTMTQSDLDLMIDVNYRGMIYVSQCAYEYLKDSKGQLLHFTSSSYTYGRPLYSLYSSAKAAVVNFVQALAQEWNPVNIRINCINPERTKTNMRLTNFGHEDDSTLLSADEVAVQAIATLLNENSGQVIDVRLKI